MVLPRCCVCLAVSLAVAAGWAPALLVARRGSPQIGRRTNDVQLKRTSSILSSRRRSAARLHSLAEKSGAVSSSNKASEEDEDADEDDDEDGDEEEEDVDVNELRLRLLQQSGVNVEKEGDPLEALESQQDPQAMELLADRLRGAFASNLLRDLDVSKLVDDELQKGGEDLERLASDLKRGQGNITTELAEEFGRAFQRETDVMLTEYEGKARRMLGAMEKEKANLARELQTMETLQREMERDIGLQIRSFRSKGLLKQSALVAAILVANQATYQGLLLAQHRGGNPLLAAGEVAAVLGLCYLYGIRPF